MSHRITDTDSVFSVREPMWHGLGHILPDYPTRDDVQRIVFPWEPVLQPLFRREIEVLPAMPALYPEDERDELRESYVEVDGVHLVQRDDNHAVLGVMGDTYTPVLNRELLDIAEALEQSSTDVRYETGGSLKGGAKVWLLLRLAEPLVVDGDPHGEVLPYFALQNAHDGTAAFRGQSIMTRIVCDNTSNLADLEARGRGTEFMFRHTASVRDRIEQAKEALAGWRHSVSEWAALNEHLITLRVSAAQSREFVERFIPMPPPHLVSPRVEQNVWDARKTLQAILASATCADVERTAYGLVQASIEYEQHHRAARSLESRFRRSYLERSKIAADAAALAQEIAR